MNSVKVSLSAKVFVNRTVNGGRVKFTTAVVVSMGPLVVATATLGGSWNADQAIAEFKKSPGRFKKREGFEFAQAARLVA